MVSSGHFLKRSGPILLDWTGSYDPMIGHPPVGRRAVNFSPSRKSLQTWFHFHSFSEGLDGLGFKNGKSVNLEAEREWRK